MLSFDNMLLSRFWDFLKCGGIVGTSFVLHIGSVNTKIKSFIPIAKLPRSLMPNAVASNSGANSPLAKKPKSPLEHRILDLLKFSKLKFANSALALIR